MEGGKMPPRRAPLFAPYSTPGEAEHQGGSAAAKFASCLVNEEGRLMELKDLYRDVILDHNKRPRNFGPA